MSSDADSERKLWLKYHTPTPDPSSSDSSGPSQLHHVTPIRPSRFLCMPFPPQSVRIIPANLDSLGLPVRPSPPSPLENRPFFNPPVTSQSGHFSFPQAAPMYAPDTSFDSSSPIFGPDSQFPTDSPMDWKSTTPPAPIPVVRAFTPFDAPPTPYGAPPTPNARPLSPFVPPVQPPAFVFDPDNPYYAPTPQPVPPTEWPSTPHRAPTSQPFPPSEWPSTPQDAPPPPPIVPLENAPAPNRAPTPPPSQGIQPQIVVTPPQEPIVDDATPSNAPMPSGTERADRRPLFNDPPNVFILNSPPHDSRPPGAFASVCADYLAEYQQTLRARIVNRPPTPRRSAWGIDIDEMDDSPVAPSDRSLNASPLALTHASMEIDGMFRDTTLGDSLLDRNESTGIWVNSERERSGQILEFKGEETLVNPPDEDMAGGDNTAPIMNSNRERRYTLPTGTVYDGQGDRLAPSPGPSGRKRELSGGDSKAAPSHQGTPDQEKRKRRKMKGKGKENFDLRSPNDA